MDFFELLQTAGWLVIIGGVALLIVCIKLIMAIFRIRNSLNHIDEVITSMAKKDGIKIENNDDFDITTYM